MWFFNLKNLYLVQSFAVTNLNITYTRIPVQAIYNGVAQKKNGSLKNFTIIHSYHDLKMFNLNKNVFHVCI